MMSREKRSEEAGYGYNTGYKRLLKVPTPVFVIPGVILFVVGMLLVILIWTPLNLWKSGTGLGANSMMAGFLFALFLAGFVYAIHLIFDWVESG